jgi:hypothetical protein
MRHPAMEKQLYLFCHDYGTGGIWCYFRAHKPNDVRRKYPMLIHVDEPPAWFTAKEEQRLLETMCFDVDAPPSSNDFLGALKRSADEYFASLGEQVLPPRGD